MATSGIPAPSPGPQGGHHRWEPGGEGRWRRHLLDYRPCVPFGETSFTLGGQKSLMAVTFLAH